MPTLSYYFYAINQITMSQPVLFLRDVSIYQGNRVILSNINLEVNHGEFIYIIGIIPGDFLLEEGAVVELLESEGLTGSGHVPAV